MRLAAVADIHGNLPALEAVAADLEARAVDAVIDLGDIVSGPLWPRGTLDAVRALGWGRVRGNHDRWVGCSPPAELSRTDAFAAGDVGEDGRAWLAALPGRAAPLPGLAAFHARPGDDNAYLLEEVADGYLRPARPGTVAARLGTLDAAVVLTAHSHQAGLVRLPDSRSVVNPGSVGCPAYHDPDHPAHVSATGSPAARYAVLTLEEAGPRTALAAVQFVALAYDHPSAARRAAALGRPDWAHALTHGTMGDVG